MDDGAHPVQAEVRVAVADLRAALSRFEARLDRGDEASDEHDLQLVLELLDFTRLALGGRPSGAAGS